MRVSELINKLEKIKKVEGDFLIKDLKITIPRFTWEWHLHSRKNKDKRMTLKEYAEVCKNKEGEK